MGNVDFIIEQFILAFGVFFVNFGLSYTMIRFVWKLIEDAEREDKGVFK